MNLDELAPRHFRVVHRIGSGMTYAEAARDLGLSRHTVRTYAREVKSQLDDPKYREMPTKTAITQWWLREGRNELN